MQCSRLCIWSQSPARDPYNNIIRTTVEAMAAVMGGVMPQWVPLWRNKVALEENHISAALLFQMGVVFLLQLFSTPSLHKMRLRFAL